MIGHCAKKIVTCDIITLDGDVFTGVNLCKTPQNICPRVDNEGYNKCTLICEQIGHAEIVALANAMSHGANVKGATAIIRGIGYSCRNCQEELYKAGIKYITIGEE